MRQDDRADQGEGALESLSDAELLRRSRDGDAVAFGELWERYRALAMSVAASLTSSEAEDVVAEAFTVLWDKIRSGEGPAETFRGYLLATVRNLAHRTYRRTGRVLTGAEHELELQPGEDHTEAIEHEELVRDVQIAFDALPARWRKVLWKSEVELLPRSQVAHDMSLSLNSTSQLLRRAKEALRVAWLNERFVHSAEDDHYTYIKDLPRYVRRGLPQTRRTKLQAHLEECGGCRAKEAQLRREDAFLASAVALLPLVGGAAWAAGQTSALASGSMAALQERVAELGEWSRTLVQLGYARTVTIAGTACVGMIVGLAALLFPPTEPVAPTGSDKPPAVDSGSGAEKEPAATESTPSPDTTTAGSAAAAAEGEGAHTGVGGPTVTVPVETGQPEPPQHHIALPTIGFGSEFTRTLPPTLVGTGEPGAPLRLFVSGAELQLSVGDDGRWAADLSELGLGVGMHSARAVQYVDSAEHGSAALNFELTLPQVSILPRVAGQDGSHAQLRIAGIAGGRVCLLSGGVARGSVVLGVDGTADVQIAAGDYPGGAVGFEYCDGVHAGPEGQVQVF